MNETLPGRPAALLVRNGFVYTADADDTIHPTGSILIVGDRIAAVADARTVEQAVEQLDPETRSGMEVIDASGSMVLPGFVNPHWHDCFLAHLLAPNGASLPVVDHDDVAAPFALGGDIRALSMLFDSWSTLADSLEADEARAIARYSLWTQLRSGTTTFGDVGSLNRPEALVEATRELGIRGAVTIWNSDACCPPDDHRFKRTRDVDAVLTRMESLLDTCSADETGRVRAMPTVIYTPNMSDELGAGLHDLVQRYDTPFATHIGALRNEAEVVRDYFGATPIRRFAQLGLLNDRLIAVHCAFATPEEQRLLMDANVRINHAPAKYGTSGEPTLSETRLIPELRQAGLDVSLSTDGETLPLGGMTEAMGQAVQTYNELAADHRALPATAALAMGTRVAARALRWDSEVGSLEAEKQADLVLVRIDDWRYLLRSRPLEGLIRLGSSNDIDTVIVAGRVLLRHGHTTFVDEGTLQREFVDALMAFTDRNGGFPRAALDALLARHAFADDEN